MKQCGLYLSYTLNILVVENPMLCIPYRRTVHIRTHCTFDNPSFPLEPDHKVKSLTTICASFDMEETMSISVMKQSRGNSKALHLIIFGHIVVMTLVNKPKIIKIR